MGAETVQKALDACIEPLLQIKDMIQKNPQITDQEIAALYNAAAKLPRLGLRPVAAMRAVLENP